MLELRAYNQELGQRLSLPPLTLLTIFPEFEARSVGGVGVVYESSKMINDTQ